MKKTAKDICMIVYTDYLGDPRVRREAEALAATPGYYVTVLSLNNPNNPREYKENGVNVFELKEKKYCGESHFKYMLSYLKFMLLSFTFGNKLFFSKKYHLKLVLEDFLDS